MEPWQRVWIDANTYQADAHAVINCTTCHAGTNTPDMDAAHQGMIDRPAADTATCGTCHRDVSPLNADSLHTTLRGYDTVLQDRSREEHYATLEGVEANHCNSCHTTCGDCHISQPTNVGGGLLKGHRFVRTPPMSQTCTACHGSRVKNEYFGLNEELPSDVHFRARMSCTDCHSSAELHGMGEPQTHRYDGKPSQSCESCHLDVIGVGSGIEQHEVHGTETLSCQACHSVAYTNCVNCHVALNDEKQPFFKVEDHFLAFYIGKNPLRGADRPYRYVTLRHVPVDATSFSFYGQDLLPNFAKRPTWVYSTPHNIQRITPQNERCDACHTNDALFLTIDKVRNPVREANLSVVVTGAPPLPEGYMPAVIPTATPASEGDFWGGDGSAGAAPTSTPTSDDFWGGDGSAGAAPTSTPTSDDFWGQ
jgi:thiosulfate/3-mercaptopyruvate sulfurtransferase